MSFTLTESEWRLLSSVSVDDLVELAVELDVLAPKEIDRRALLEQCVPLIVERAREEGLPFSKYDAEDLRALPPHLLTAIGRLQGLRGEVTVERVLRAGRKVYRYYQKHRRHSAVALLLPSLLSAVARASTSG